MACCAALAPQAFATSSPRHARRRPRHLTRRTLVRVAAADASNDEKMDEEKSGSGESSADAAPSSAPESTSNRAKEMPPVVVFGARGKTGKRCVQVAARSMRAVVACTRDGSFSTADLGLSAEEADLVTAKPGDVSKATPADLADLVAGARAVIFAASASPNGGNPQEVDKAGLVAVARACIAAKVPRLVIVSSGSVTKPLSPVYVFLNFFGGIMRAKIEGEDAVRQLYYDREGCDYVVVRPGGLTEDEGRGVGAIELNQGDDKSGRIARADVAVICVEAAFAEAGSDVANATFECYWADTAKSLDEVGLSNLMGSTSEVPDYKSGKERRGATWDELFAGLEADAPGVSQQGCGPSL